MKKFITAFLIGFFLLFSVSANAITQTKVFTQGMYSIDSEKLLTGINYKVRNTSTGKSLLIVIDANESMQQLLRLEPNSPEYILKPFNFGDILIIIGSSKLEFY